ncbi:MAG: NAD-dependent epimerase/dehydratase family protein [Candidatus Lokiarchaeota archaeon]|nr:NAD-dependent epimerase/dehydratase family protein [Candidatus Lokiarchaeota archaeon]MBD3339275.1 NAD-dependent epimerase/dehydratase family protein [Candidatus Lokiarchaeota archaeon]
MKIKDKSILITGGAGFIGSHLADRLLAEGANRVIVYDNFSTGKKKYLEGKDIEIFNGDILDYNHLNECAKNIDIISHHAAELEVFTGINNTVHDLKTNIIGTLNVLNAAINNNIKKLVYASSGGVYGQAQEIPQTESHPLMPHWPYGVSKLAGEKYCTQYYLLYGLPTVSFRYGIVYGPREWYGRVLTLFIKRALEGKSPIIFGNGEQRRDYVYVDDIVEANVLAIKNDKANGKVFNLGGDKAYSINQVANLILRNVNLEISPIYDNPEPGKASKHQPNRKRLPGELIDFILDSSLIKKTLNYQAKTSFEEGIQKEIIWIKNNMDIWDCEPRV